MIYTFEFPEIVYGTSNTNSPANTHVLTELFRYIVNNPAPSKKEIMEETKAVLYGNVSSDFTVVYQEHRQDSRFMKQDAMALFLLFRHGNQS